jgi:hypothetical protein
MLNELEVTNAKITKAIDKVSAVLVKELGADKEFADLTAQYCITTAFSPNVPKKSFYQKARPYASETYRKLKTPVLVLCIILTVFFGAKWLFYDHAHWFSTYPRTYVRAEGWRPQPGNYTKGKWSRDFDWDRLKSVDTGPCFESGVYGRDDRPQFCFHNSLIPKLNVVLEDAVQRDLDGEVWRGSNGNGLIVTISRSNYRFVIKAEEDPALD